MKYNMALFDMIEKKYQIINGNLSAHDFDVFRRGFVEQYGEKFVISMLITETDPQVALQNIDSRNFSDVTPEDVVSFMITRTMTPGVNLNRMSYISSRNPQSVAVFSKFLPWFERLYTRNKVESMIFNNNNFYIWGMLNIENFKYMMDLIEKYKGNDDERMRSICSKILKNRLYKPTTDMISHLARLKDKPNSKFKYIL